MIRYALTCDQEHRFESWFQSASAFDGLMERGLVLCEVCGSKQVKKALMTPGVPVKSNASPSVPDAVPEMPAEPAASVPAPAQAASGPLSSPGSQMEEMMKKLRDHVDANSTYVGQDFAQEARDMHLGDTPERQIHGEASAEEARELLEDGIPILPLPGVPKSRSN